MHNNPTLPPTKLVLRTFTTDLSAEAVKLKLQRIVEKSALFNTSFLNGEWAEDTRIGGFDQHGDIVIRHRSERAKHELTIEHRAGEVLSIKPDREDVLSRGHICPKAVALKDLHEDPDRLRRPMKRTPAGWEEITWSTAFEEVERRIGEVAEIVGEHGQPLRPQRPLETRDRLDGRRLCRFVFARLAVLLLEGFPAIAFDAVIAIGLINPCGVGENIGDVAVGA
jgi:hypothetical protein